jgi:hypothetical protein
VLSVSIPLATRTRACRLVGEYMQLAPSDMVADSVELLCGEAVLRMVHTHAGARAGAMVAAYSSPKERKKLLKAMKGHVVKMCLDEFAYIPLIKLLAVVDDTQLVQKCAVAEISVRRRPPAACLAAWRAPARAVRRPAWHMAKLHGRVCSCLQRASCVAFRSGALAGMTTYRRADRLMLLIVDGPYKPRLSLTMPARLIVGFLHCRALYGICTIASCIAE